MNTIYRIEHIENGWGIHQQLNRKDSPFSLEHGLSCYKQIEAHHNSFPSPRQEGHKRSNDEFCAFLNKDQLNLWMRPEWWPELLSIGFRLYEIVVSEMIVLSKQVIFKKENIITKKEIPYELK